MYIGGLGTNLLRGRGWLEMAELPTFKVSFRGRVKISSSLPLINFCFYFLWYTDLEIGFDKTEVTVIEGETVLLNASFKNNISFVDYGGSGFSVYIYDEGNVTGIAKYVLRTLQS